MKKNIVFLAFLLMLADTSDAAFFNKNEQESALTTQSKTKSSFKISELISEEKLAPEAKIRKRKSPKNDNIKRWKKARRVWLILMLALGFGPFLITVAAFGIGFAFWAGPVGLIAGAFYGVPFFIFGIIALVMMLRFNRKIKKAQENPEQYNPNPTPQPQYRIETPDAVYLKNGSIIKGTVLEIIPNQIIKIEIPGGSVLVYKMEEVEKMVRE